jgi:hypothetical protein
MYKFYLNKLKIFVEIMYSVLLVISCVYTYLKAPVVIYLLSSGSNSAVLDILSMFSRSVAIVCLISRITILYKSTSDFFVYKKKIEYYELYYPMELLKKKIQRIFNTSILLAYIAIIFPLNIYRIYLIYHNYRNMILVLFYMMMYLQNISICWTEICFIVNCMGLYLKFQTINYEMAELKAESIKANKFPVVLQTERRSNRLTDPGSTDGFISSNSSVHHLANSIEQLRMRHQFVRCAVIELSNLYSIQIVLSVCVLFVMTLFDIYAQVTNKDKITKTQILFYGWLFQYSFRFCIIILTTHVTTKQVPIYSLI